MCIRLRLYSVECEYNTRFIRYCMDTESIQFIVLWLITNEKNSSHEVLLFFSTCLLLVSIGNLSEDGEVLASLWSGINIIFKIEL